MRVDRLLTDGSSALPGPARWERSDKAGPGGPVLLVARRMLTGPEGDRHPV
jgi:hypothetical protein